MRFPDYIYEDEDLIDYAYSVEHAAWFAWSHAARRIMWRAFTARAKFIPSQAFFDEGHYEGEHEASEACDEKLAIVCEVLDMEQLWKACTGISLYETIERWLNEPGMYGWYLSKKTCDDFDAVSAAMFPIDTWADCSSEPVEPPFPECGEDGKPDYGKLLRWASDLMVMSGMRAGYEAYRAGVPLSDVAGIPRDANKLF